ncbi:Hsp70/Hsp90 co-chaperone CNS1 [Wickerhamiella sorbophila]|uniref:Hsp70/Hsp90 co-chaperone CNS1 n=1 Tax=Wickerhamiella sorbophila TaxID=45607 RepID=A0A2T0FG82_9ASCO|nr:Hsp70/Hsp90 co-chaperone CNS1 [Wickerhamiella sorbophila]PRT53990.1 Hsp70/Hsp90 co-chaperone CNS1 [Wickerhamiella sorbophila]
MDTSAPLKDILEEYKDKPVDHVLKELNKVPFFMTEMPDEENPAVEALKAMAYEGEPHEIAQNFRNQGNDCFKLKQYKDAIAFYTKALDQSCRVDEIELACLGNRAQANLELKNFRRAINDCTKVLDRDPKNVKAWYRSSKAFLLLDRSDEAIVCADYGLQCDPGSADLQTIKNSAATRRQKLRDMEEARRLRQEQAELQQKTLNLALASRGFTRAFAEADADHRRAAGELKCQLENPNDATSHLSVPALLLYPLSLESDIVEQASETDTVGGLLEMVFTQPPPWATADYRLGNLEVYAQTRTGGLAKAPLKASLAKLFGTQKPDIIMIDDLARLYVVPKNQASQWLSTWDKQQAQSQLSYSN